MRSFGLEAAKGSFGLNPAVWYLSNAPRGPRFVPPRETVVISLIPPNSAALAFWLIRISSMALKEGKSSVAGMLERTFIVLIPSTVTDRRLGFAPATEIFPAASGCTPACQIIVA